MAKTSKGHDFMAVARRVVLHLLLFVAVLAVLTALAIWLELGPVVHSWQV